MWMTRSIAPPPPKPALLSNQTARNDYIVILALCTKRSPLRLNLKAIMIEYVAKRNASDLVGKIRDIHLLIGHPNERRSSLKVLLTSSGEGHSVHGIVSVDSCFLRVRDPGGGLSGVNSKSRLVSGELAMELRSVGRVALLRSSGDFRPKFTDSPFEHDLRRIRQSSGGRRSRGRIL
jgi:hypothetical protein